MRGEAARDVIEQTRRIFSAQKVGSDFEDLARCFYSTMRARRAMQDKQEYQDRDMDDERPKERREACMMKISERYAA